MFPYHYGSHATYLKAEDNKLRKRQFPYHYGSHATQKAGVAYAIKNSFHTTMVLTQRTVMCRSTTWNQKSFHTTMVLTQRLSFSLEGIGCLCSFHTTMVLTQRNNMAETANIYKEVSIPLWFSRNESIISSITLK